MRKLTIPTSPCALLDPMTDAPVLVDGKPAFLTWDHIARIFCLSASMRAALTTFEIDSLKDRLKKATGSELVEEKAWEAMCKEIDHPTVFLPIHVTSPDVLSVFRAIKEAEKVDG